MQGCRLVCHRPALQRIEKGDQVRLLLLGEMHAEAGIVKVDQFEQVRRRPVVKVWRTCRQAAKHRSFAPVEITAQA